MNTTKQDYCNIKNLLKKYSDQYYNEGQSEISDAAYDKLYQQLLKIEELHPEFKNNQSPSQIVGAEPKGNFKKIKHENRMLSLENSYSNLEVFNFFKTKEELIGEPKYDGLSLKLNYENGKLIWAATRGSGDVGDDVTINAKQVNGVLHQLPIKWTGEICGEVLMLKSVFNLLNAECETAGESLFANPRNAAAGSLKQKNPEITKERKLNFYAYKSSNKVFNGIIAKTQVDIYANLADLGFKVPEAYVIDCTEENIHQVIIEYSETRGDIVYEIDGIVFKLNNLDAQEALGEGTKTPNWATAYKFPPEQAQSTIESITFQVGRQGTVTPVAELTPTRLSGSIVRRATLHNKAMVEALDVRPGSRVIIVKAAEIIPQVIKVIDNSKADTWWKFIETCPCCGTTLVRVTNASGEDSTALYCPNTLGCADQVFQRLRYSLGKAALDMDGCGEAMIALLIQNGVRKLSDIFKVDHFESAEGTVIQSAATNKFFIEREKVKSAPLWRKYCALGIEGIGVTASKELANKFPTIELLSSANSKEIESLVGPIAASRVVAFLTENSQELQELIQSGFTFTSTTVGGKLSGKTFVITGQLLSGSRGAISAKIESYGGMVKGSVSRKVNYLVVGDGGGANKAAGAEKHGTKCITEEELYALMGEEFNF